MSSPIRPAFPIFLFWLILAFPALTSRADGPPLTEREFVECPQCPRMIGIPGGTGQMGSPQDEKGRFGEEGPQHKVTVKPFALAKYPVSVAEFLVFLRDTDYQSQPCNKTLGLQWHNQGKGRAMPPTETQPPDWPATCLSWNDAQAYIAWLNGKVTQAGRKGRYRLPSEAEWEYAARAGTRTARWWGEEMAPDHANCLTCGSRWDGRTIAPLGSLPDNPFGLSDMLGNVWQWVEDCWHESYEGAPDDGSAWEQPGCKKRVMRGGSWSNQAIFLRSAARGRAEADGSDLDYASYAGFRLARNLP